MMMMMMMMMMRMMMLIMSPRYFITKMDDQDEKISNLKKMDQARFSSSILVS